MTQLLSQSDIIALHCPLTLETHHLVNEDAIAQMKPHVMLINTSRGALIDTDAVITALKSSQISALGLDVYEQEAELFFEDRSDRILQDDTFARPMTFPNVMITGHQAFFTEDTMRAIAEVTLENLTQIEQESVKMKFNWNLVIQNLFADRLSRCIKIIHNRHTRCQF
jgi:D-lactate dehydrogenase